MKFFGGSLLWFAFAFSVYASSNIADQLTEVKRRSIGGEAYRSEVVRLVYGELLTQKPDYVIEYENGQILRVGKGGQLIREVSRELDLATLQEIIGQASLFSADPIWQKVRAIIGMCVIARGGKVSSEVIMPVFQDTEDESLTLAGIEALGMIGDDAAIAKLIEIVEKKGRPTVWFDEENRPVFSYLEGGAASERLKRNKKEPPSVDLIPSDVAVIGWLERLMYSDRAYLVSMAANNIGFIGTPAAKVALERYVKQRPDGPGVGEVKAQLDRLKRKGVSEK